ncbi:MAG: hypothetical protein ACR2OE_17420 [Thermomicrobiales bacterium]
MVRNSRNLDTQPEQDVRPSKLVSLSMGLMLGSGLIMGALIGALIGHFLLDDAFGLGHDVTVGAIAGAIVGAILSITSVKVLSSRVAEKNRHGS